MSIMNKPASEVLLAAPAVAVDRVALTPHQWRSGLAAWLGWLFDGLDIHLYTLVAVPFVAELLQVQADHPAVKEKAAWIQAAFLVGWALGGAFFGRVGDIVGRSRALAMTIATYACFTGLSFFARTWWELMGLRFLAALGIGGEWAVGSSLLSETWPSRWRVWAAAVLQTAVNVGILIACIAAALLAGHPRAVFLVGVLPAVVVYWVRRHVPEPLEWQAARDAAKESGDASHPRTAMPGLADLFRGPVRRTTLLTVAVCACSLTGWWAFLFWHIQHLRSLPDVAAMSPDARDRLASAIFFLVIGVSVGGNFFAALFARWIGYRRSIALMCLGFFASIFLTYRTPLDHIALIWRLLWIGFFSGVFALFTMYLPPLFPTLLRTTGAGFSFNIGRLAAAAGTIVFGLFGTLHGAEDLRRALWWDAFLFLPAAGFALLMPERREGSA